MSYYPRVLDATGPLVTLERFPMDNFRDFPGSIGLDDNNNTVSSQDICNVFERHIYV